MRTEYCGKLCRSHVGKQVSLCGWVNCRRDLGKLIFIDMRDCEGIVQVLFDLNQCGNIKNLVYELRNEFCIQVIGTVRARDKKNINIEMLTGDIEVLASTLIVINRAESLPIDLNQTVSEDIRFKYRYLDLRRPEKARYLKIRSQISRIVRHFMDVHGFLDIETPTLTKSTPEGANDYLVPSRIYKGKFYSLPQSPQLFKQLLMISGFDRYYQIVKCFRDEDLRSDRQPEFTQIDMETSFMTAEQVRELMEILIRELWKEMKGINLGKFPVMTYSEVKIRFGSDKPDLRNPLEIVDITDLLEKIGFSFFSDSTNNSKNCISVLPVPGGANLRFDRINYYRNLAKTNGVKNLIYIKVDAYKKGFNVIDGSVISFLNEDITKAIMKHVNAKDGDIIFLCADTEKIVADFLGALRMKVGKDLNLIDYTKWTPLWIIDFPMFWSNGKDTLSAMHHPFTSPKNMTVTELRASPEKAVANSYDMIINGYEVASGSVRIHSREMQETVFEILNINKQDQLKQFGFFLDAMRFGTPPHAGLAFGLDRLTMLLSETDNIRDVIAFPKTTSASCLMTEAPDFSNPQTLIKLGIKIEKNKE